MKLGQEPDTSSRVYRPAIPCGSDPDRVVKFWISICLAIRTIKSSILQTDSIPTSNTSWTTGEVAWAVRARSAAEEYYH